MNYCDYCNMWRDLNCKLSNLKCKNNPLETNNIIKITSIQSNFRSCGIVPREESLLPRGEMGENFSKIFIANWKQTLPTYMSEAHSALPANIARDHWRTFEAPGHENVLTEAWQTPCKIINVEELCNAPPLQSSSRNAVVRNVLLQCTLSSQLNVATWINYNINAIANAHMPHVACGNRD